MRTIREGDIYETSRCGKVEVIQYISAVDIRVRFINTGWVRSAPATRILTGKIKDVYAPLRYGVGFMGEGLHKSKEGTSFTPVYQAWVDMIRRCYYQKGPQYHRYGGRGVVVCDDWHNFQIFADWCSENYIEGYHLDKDLKVRGSLIYSPETCEFIPKRVNNLILSSTAARGKWPVGVSYHKRHHKYCSQCNVNGSLVHLGDFDDPEEAFKTYKKFKESYVKSVAEECYLIGQISQQIYESLMSWTINIEA